MEWLNGKYDRGIMPSLQKKKGIKLLRFGESNFYTYYEQRADPSGRAVYGVGLRPLAC